MIDAETQRPIRVHAEGTAGPYVMVPVTQLGAVQELLQRQGVYFWVDEDAISLDGKPEIAVINFGANGRADAIQRILDQQS